ncbi:Branched-chain amino acid transport system / permease component [Neomoorella glycerini]|uniref:Branched-chain amino acid transport system / permease component n=1 Tax=Neomoorella glycerini TaxID=55779 RepID=A0A6I5ZPJ7_9FIRM|nr:branched-chain amino acid ABC transporter permease [Moorella glycerini]QGP91904.1 Branched-chain amino acid transport system / permease component [Moorella glycerini]
MTEVRFSKKNLLTLAGALLVYFLIFSLQSLGMISKFQEINLMMLGINIILAVSLNLIVGFTGQLALGHAGFMAVGAYVAAILTMKLHQPFLLAIIAGALAAALAGIIIGLPTLRLKGDYLAIATLGFGEIIKGVANNINYIGGAAGMIGIPRLTSWTWLYLMMVLTILVIVNFLNSTHGRACVAIRENEIAAETMGINTTYYKVLAFAIGAFFAGIAGALYAHYFYLIQPTTFTFFRSFDILVMVVFGGLGSITGSIIAAAAITLINAALQDLAVLRMVIYAILLIVIMVFRPQGLMGTKEFTLDRWVPKRGEASGSAGN